MKVVEMVFEVHETCQNGKERVIKKKVYADRWFCWEEAKELLEDRGYYEVLLLDAEWKDVLVIG